MQRALAGRRRRMCAELVGVLEQLKKLDRVFDAVDAEFERVDGPGTDGDGGLGVRGEGLVGGEREIGLILGLAEPGGGGGEQQDQLRVLFHNASLRMFQRYTPRKLGLAASGRQSSCGKWRSSDMVRRLISPGPPPIGAGVVDDVEIAVGTKLAGAEIDHAVEACVVTEEEQVAGLRQGHIARQEMGIEAAQGLGVGELGKCAARKIAWGERSGADAEQPGAEGRVGVAILARRDRRPGRRARERLRPIPRRARGKFRGRRSG